MNSLRKCTGRAPIPVTPILATPILATPILVMPVLVALALAGPLGPLAARAQGAPADSHLPVTTITAQTAPQSHDFTLTGTIQAPDSYAAGFRDGGRVISVSVDVGDTLRAGDEIARVDPAQALSALRAAQASLDAAEAALSQARQARDRADGLLQRGSGTQADLDRATESFLTARAARDQALAQLDSARRAEEDTVLLALDDAIVTERSAEAGQVVGAGQAIVTLASRGGREAVFLVPNFADLDDFLGRSVTLTPLEGDGASLSAPVTEISPVVAENGTVTAKAAIPGMPEAGFTIGAPVQGQLQIAGDPVIQIPWDALNGTREGPAVWLYDPATSRVALRDIQIAAYRTGTIEVASGLEDGDVVVTGGSHGLFPGRVVNRREADQ